MRTDFSQIKRVKDAIDNKLIKGNYLSELIDAKLSFDDVLDLRLHYKYCGWDDIDIQTFPVDKKVGIRFFYTRRKRSC
jgi:hypothetical protein